MRQRFSMRGLSSLWSELPAKTAPATATTTSKKHFSLLQKQQQEETVCFSCASKLLQQDKKKQHHVAKRAYNTQQHQAAAVFDYEPSSIENYVTQQLHHPLDPLFKPKNVAVIGASEKVGSVGRTLLWNLMATPFGGTVYPVNPKRKNVMGILAYPDIKSIPDAVDLAVICIPAPQVPQAVKVNNYICNVTV